MEAREDFFSWPDLYSCFDEFPVYESIIGECRDLERHLNDLVKQYWEDKSKKSQVLNDLVEIYFRHFEHLRTEPNYLTRENLSKLLRAVIEEYGTSSRDVSLPESGEHDGNLRIYSVVHPLVVAFYSSGSWVAQSSKCLENALVAGLLHDIPEDRLKRHRESHRFSFQSLEWIVEDVLDIVEDNMGEEMGESRRATIASLKESLIDLSRVSKEEYDHHITRLFFDKRLSFFWIDELEFGPISVPSPLRILRIPKRRAWLFGERAVDELESSGFGRLLSPFIRYSLNPESVLIPNLMVKLGDRLHNVLSMGVLDSNELNGAANNTRGFGYGKRMEVILKNMYLIDATANFFNYLMLQNEGLLPIRYGGPFKLFCHLHHATLGAITEMIDSVCASYSEESEERREFELIDTALTEYKQAGGLAKATRGKREFDWYLRNWTSRAGVVERRRGPGPVDPEIFDGTIEAIRAKVDKLFRGELYGGLNEPDKLYKLYTHLIAMRECLIGYFGDYTESPLVAEKRLIKFRHIEGFADLPAPHLIRETLEPRYGIVRTFRREGLLAALRYAMPKRRAA
ncbi:hypothetical protein JW930_03485 [Candidatus Woesearchaeota archaeon]|nr:hypothetical protein [Candidatus Woesearchaeota archaeon]